MINIVTILLSSTVEAITSVMLIKTFMRGREKVPGWISIIATIVLALMIAASNIFFKYGVYNAIGMTLSVFIVSYIYRGKTIARLVISVSSVCLTGLSEIVMLFALAFFMGVSTADIVNSETTRLLGTVLSKTLSYAIVKFICVKSNSSVKQTPTYWTMYFIIFSTALLTVFTFFHLSYNNHNESINNLAIISSAGLLFSVCFTLYLYESMLKQTEQLGRQKALEEQMKAQTKHIDEILLTQTQLKKFRHDLKNHCIALTAFFNNKDYNNGIKYLNKISDYNVRSSNEIDTGNITLDAILNSKKALAESKHISFKYNLHIPEHINMEPEDISVIFGNALDNAIEANEKLAVEERYINISMVYDTSLICKISNACVHKKIDILTTSKTDKSSHGFGLENIRSALKRYNGIINIEQTDNEFYVKLYIFL